MVSTFRRDLDPLDREILELALEGAWDTLKEKRAVVDLESDEALEAALRRELMEIAEFNGVSDPDTLRDMLVAELSGKASPVRDSMNPRRELVEV